MAIRPFLIPSYIKSQQKEAEFFLMDVESIRTRIQRFSGADPEVTIIIPAFNEEATILRCLSSLSMTKTSQKIEVLVVNNNSTDRTQQVVESVGVKCIMEHVQGVKHARTTALHNAKSNIILSADADSIYSPYWVDMLSLPLRNSEVACTYGRFAFIPEKAYKRFFYFLYETMGDFYKNVLQINKDKAMYVYGCSSGYRKNQAISVNGYEHPVGANEDGYLALKLRNKYGALCKVTTNKSLVWTSNRQLLQQGGLLSSLKKRVKHYLNI